ncbi:protein-disulfide reductase DsbD family protein [Pedobacter mucosus]|uniref:protein-disulfide reductase DsbD family protein n=1 Tax=Pedobacter mucosus TaxID=2895286 RepID=UPI001EE4B47B|nr:cytochrome c biogenesis protein CcdA [Pedobacter mucosus]UKT65004.1 thioredoxin family protein [Pedobacter mucosus]
MINLKKIILGCLLLCALSAKAMAQDSSASDELTFTEIMPEAVDGDTIKTVDSAARTKFSTAAVAQNEVANQIRERKSLWGIFITGFAGGLAALLMPCIFPMLPLTVSFFTKGSQKGKAFGRSALYGFFIIAIYVVLGLLVTVIFGADALNSLSTNGVFNFFFFLLLVVFAASFLGAFEITLPSSWVNKMDSGSDKGGIAGLFFMAGTLALVSFSCTGPIIGTLLVQAATTGALLGPSVGMFGFSLALAIPFALFSLFPSAMNSLPKSGGWLNSVKVILGFLELAFALKFLSNVDLAYHWEWFDREIFLSLWVVIFGTMGMYLLGKLSLSHDSPMKSIPVPRLFLATMVLAFTIYLIPGLWGAPLRCVSAFLPPQETQDFDLYTTGLLAGKQETINEPPHKYTDKFHPPLKLNAYFDYNEGLREAKKRNMPVLIDFTGHACVNCRKMEANVWPEKRVYEMISREYILIQLYVDDKSDLAPADVVITPEGRTLGTIGKKWSDLQARKFGSNSQPFYVLLDPKTETLLADPQGADYEVEGYIKFLERGLHAFNK